ncbi:MAG TPA: hypothetical protein VNQ78_13395 [Paracoccus sp. (in: a-proteobacteria)]|uniref:hypothetical protein n=1 Tax=Paracoccus sp. TaxID=267 RepID=UPI002CF7F3B3|nr:hypothetical protein [Paracoccus sp. (in: a-proteobacteria)]HWL57650.1 hypothetical protein [Paracoccus sp. (in: a-proteobacteria)]
MKNLGWLAVTLALFIVTLVLTGWPAFKDLGHQREWKAVAASSTEGELHGIQVGIREVKAAVVDNRPDRALLFLRMELQGPQSAMESWTDCRASLQSASGERWLPIEGYSIRAAIQILASDGKDNGNCSPAGVTGNAPATFDQIYRLPAGELDNLTLKVSGYGTRPEALAFPIRPEVRRFPSP